MNSIIFIDAILALVILYFLYDIRRTGYRLANCLKNKKNQEADRTKETFETSIAEGSHTES